MGRCHSRSQIIERSQAAGAKVMGNIMLLMRIHPDEVYRWFMGLYLDAYDWVMVPNVYAMSQNADGGAITTKPYFSGSSYIRKMSHYKAGPWCETWDGLYWRWILKQSDQLAKNPRWAMMCSMAKKMDARKREQHRRHDDRDPGGAGHDHGGDGQEQLRVVVLGSSGHGNLLFVAGIGPAPAQIAKNVEQLGIEIPLIVGGQTPCVVIYPGTDPAWLPLARKTADAIAGLGAADGVADLAAGTFAVADAVEDAGGESPLLERRDDEVVHDVVGRRVVAASPGAAELDHTLEVAELHDAVAHRELPVEQRQGVAGLIDIGDMTAAAELTVEHGMGGTVAHRTPPASTPSPLREDCESGS